MIDITSNIDQIVQRFKVMKERAQGMDLSEALVVGVNAARGKMSFRIFNEGQDSSNNTLGQYRGAKTNARNTFSEFLVGSSLGQLSVTPYEKKRLKKGRQIRYKDLEFEGALRRGIVVIKESSTRVVAAIPNDQLALIARGQEEQLKKTIFSLSNDEREFLRQNVIAAIKQLYGRLLNS